MRTPLAHQHMHVGYDMTADFKDNCMPLLAADVGRVTWKTAPLRACNVGAWGTSGSDTIEFLFKSVVVKNLKKVWARAQLGAV